MSADPNSPHFDVERNAVARVFLDGVAQDAALELDTEEGWIDRIAQAPGGGAIIEGNSFKTERCYGKVEVILDS